ncbi:MAG: hypothetical protein AAGE84_10255 [Cyanobacteria bacterium P01_G01_bin.39]
MSEKQIFVQGDYYEQSGNHGAGHVSDSNFKGQTKLGGIINEEKESINNTSDKKTETTKFLEITISAEFEAIDLEDIKQIHFELISKLEK